MNFRLWTIFYVFALAAAAIATFGPWGILLAALVLATSAWLFQSTRNRRFKLLELLAVVGIVLLLIALLMPAISSARGAALRSQCMKNLKEIQLALLNHEAAKGSLPPAYIADATGKPMHSWRVLILPYLGEMALYNKYNFNEPWNGPNNSKLAAQVPAAFRCAAHPKGNGAASTETHYFAIVDPATAWPNGAARPIPQFTDGTSKTITVMEASGLATNWMEPRDLSLAEAVELLTTKPRSGHRHFEDRFLTMTYYDTSYRHVAFCDGSVHRLDQHTDAGLARALLTAAGGEVIPQAPNLQYIEPKTTTIIKWGKVWGLSVFIVLSLLPAVLLYRSSAKIDRDAEREQDIASEQAAGVAADVKAAHSAI
jgi:type II secretory pathway pseudopilin PulG